MRTCLFCNQELPDITKFCQKCGARIITVGRDAENDIVIPPQRQDVSRYHLEVAVKDGDYSVRDVDSRYGTFLNNPTPENRIPPNQVRKVNPSDVLYLSTYKFPVDEIKSFLEKQEAPDKGTILPGAVQIPIERKSGTVIIKKVGRAKDNDLVLPHEAVSKYHAKLLIDEQGITVEDLSSRNGTFVNNERLAPGEKKKLRPGDRLRFAVQEVEFDEKYEKVIYRGDVKVDVIDVTRQEQERGVRKNIVSGISFTVYPSELVGIMGPAGSGKTTLLLMMSGYKEPNEGDVLINDINLHKNYEGFRGNIGYVPQDEILHRQLTVYESLYYAAKLKLEKNTTEEEIKNRIDEVLEEVGLTDIRLRGRYISEISGGERKRVNIAHELITQPRLMLLDEPTSGLSALDARKIVELLRELAEKGRTVILTLHQPSADTYKLLDNVVVLNKGKMLYYGPAFPQAINYFDEEANVTKETMYFPDVTEILEDKTPEDYNGSDHHKNYVLQRREASEDEVILEGEFKTRSRRPGFRQWTILTDRYIKLKQRDKGNLLVLLLQAPIIAILVSLTLRGNYSASVSPVLYFLTLSAIWLGCSSAARDIVAEHIIYTRERMVNLKIPSYVFSKIIVLQGIAVFQCAVLLIIVYLGVGMKGDFFKMYGILLLASFTSISLGLLISSLVISTEVAVNLVPLVLIPFILLGGPFVLYKSANIMIQSLSRMTITRWVFSALLNAEIGGQTVARAQNIQAFNEASDLGLLGENIWLNTVVLAFFGFFFTLCIMAFLKKRDIK